MKKLIVLFLTLLLLLSACHSDKPPAVTDPTTPTEAPGEVMVDTYVLTKRTVYNNETTGVFEFTYDDSYRTVSYTQSTDGINGISKTYDLFLKTDVAETNYYEGEPGSSSYKNYEYDQFGNPTEYRLYVNDSLRRTTVFENTYDGDRLTQVRELNDGELVSLIRYNENGRVVEDISYVSDQEENLRTEYFYDEAGRLVEEVNYIFERESYRLFSTYDENGNLIKRALQDQHGTDESFWEYSDDGKITLNGYVGTHHQRYLLFSYDEEGNLIKRNAYHADRYDAEGKPIDCPPSGMSVNPYFSSEGRYDYFYDDGKLIKETFTEKGKVRSYLYSYDDNGCLISYEELDVNGNVWLRYTFEYAPATISQETCDAISAFTDHYLPFRDPYS